MKQMLIVVLLFVYFSPPSIAKQDNERSCFVIGNPEFNQAKHKPGSHKNPYNSLAEVQADDSCKVIHVLYSDTALDGGLWLKDGQKLIGKKGKKGALPIITNTTWNVSGGGVILARNNEIKNIHFKDTLNTSIAGFYDNQPFGGKIKLNNVLVTGANQAGLYLPNTGDTVPLPSVLMVSIEDVDISIKNSDIGQSNVSSIFIFTYAGHGEVSIENTIVHDQAQLSENYEASGGISISAHGNSSLNALIKNVRVDNVGSEYFSNSDGLLLINYGSGAVTGMIDGYHYSNSEKRGHSGTSCGIELGYWGAAGGGSLTAVVKNSIIEDAYWAGIQILDGVSGGYNNLDVTLVNNEIKNPTYVGIEAFGYSAPNSSISLNMQNNTISNAGNAGISIGANNGPLETFEVFLENNTIENAAYGLLFQQTNATIGNLAVDSGLGGLGSAGLNRIINSAENDIITDGMVVIAENNWWGSDTGPMSVIEVNGGAASVTPFLLADPNP